VPFLITNQEQNYAYAWSWIRQNPGPALALSFEHIWDTFGGSYPWPPNATRYWPESYAFHYLFLGLVLLPALICLVDVLRQRGLVGLLRSRELLVVSPLFGLALSVFLATGEGRYRVPWDGLLIILAVEFYRRARWRFGDPGVAAESDPALRAEDLRIERRIRMGALAAGVVLALVTVRAVVWAWPDTHRFRASSGDWGFAETGTVGWRGDHGLFFHTKEEENPWVEIDLGAVREFDRVIVDNRDDCCSDRAVPLVVEVGETPDKTHEVARKTEVFQRWVGTFPKQKARYLRLHVPRRTTFHLRSVEVL